MWRNGSDASNRSNGGLAVGCHLTRDTSALVQEAGFVMQRNEQSYVRGPKPWCWLTVGVATKPVA